MDAHASIKFTLKWRQSGFFWTAAIFITAFIVRLIYLLSIRRVPFYIDMIIDSRRYDEWAQAIAAGDWLGSGVFYQAPLYPYFLAGLYSIVGHNLFWARLIQILLGSLSCVLCFQSGRLFFGRAAGIAAGIMLAFYAPAIFFDPLIQKACFDLFFMSAALVLLGSGMKYGAWWTWAAVGFVFGCFTLTRESALLLVLILAGWILLEPRAGGIKRRLSFAGLLLFGAALPLLPVYIRNVRFGSVMSLTTYNVGTSFYIGNNSSATGTYMPLRESRGATEFEETDAGELAMCEAGRSLAPDEISRFWFYKAMREIRAAPVVWLRLLGVKAALSINRIEAIDTDDIYFYELFSAPLRILNSFWNFGLLLPLAVAGIVMTRHRWRNLMPLNLMIAGLLAGLIIFYVVARYRHAMIPLLVVFAGAAVAEAWQALRRRRQRELPGPVLAALIVFILCRLPIASKNEQLATSYFNAAGIHYKRGEYGMAEDFYRKSLELGRLETAGFVNLAVALMNAGELTEARQLLEKALPDAPDKASIFLNLGNIAIREGRTTDALQLCMRARGINRDSPEIENSLGLALALSGKREESIAHFQRAIELKPDYASPRRNLALTLQDTQQTTASLGLSR